MSLLTQAIGQIEDLQFAIRSTLNNPQSPLRSEEKEKLAEYANSILRWQDLSTTERIMLRFCWEYCHRSTCPLPLWP